MRLALALALLAAMPAAADPFERSPIKDWTVKPPPGPEPSFTPPVAKRMKLANGIALLVVENRALPIVSMVLVVQGAGAAADPAGKGGLAAFTADLLDEGAGGASALQLAEEQARLGANVATDVTADAAVVTVTGLAKSLDATLALATRIVTQPAFDAHELDRVKGDRSTALELLRDRPRDVATLVLNSALYGPQSAYGHAPDGTRASFQALQGGDARAFYRARYAPAAMTLVVSGDVDAAALAKQLDAGLGAWKPAGTTPAPAASGAAARPGKRLLLVDRPGAVQSDVRIGLVGPDRRDKRYYAFEVMRTALGDGFTSRLEQKLREQMGIIYHGYARMFWRRQPGPFEIEVAINGPDTARGIVEIVKMVDDFAANDMPPAELEKVKQNLIRALPTRFETNLGTAWEIAELVSHGLPEHDDATYAAQIRRVTAADVKAAAKALLPSGGLVFSIVGDLAKIRTSLDVLKLGEPALFDAYGAAK